MLLQTSDGTINIVSGKKITGWSEDDIKIVSGGKSEFSSIGGTLLKSDDAMVIHSGVLSEIKCTGSYIFESVTGNINVTTPAGVIELN
jgi:uncharacterized protein YdeI (BOF family)